LKREVATQPILLLPSFDKPFIVECDERSIAVGAILSQEGRQVVFFSERLNEAKYRYSSYDLELYALVQALKKWRYYLFPKEFVVFTDNQALSFLNNQEKLSHKHTKWVESV
jgi:ribonuclease HI